MKILIIEDEYALADAVSEILKKENFIVDIITDGEKGEDEALTGIYDLIILDVMLPSKNGFEILETIKKAKIKSPVIMLTAKSEMDDKLQGLENGADDYITKPFHIRELVARVKNILKRNVGMEQINIIKYEDLELNLDTCELNCNNNSIAISGKEQEIIQLLMLNKNQIVNKEMITNKIWGYESESEYNNVEVYISFIRRKLKMLNSKVKIKAVRYLGYKMEVEEHD